MNDFDLQQQLLNQRRQQYAEQQNIRIPQGQMVSGHYVAPNVLQYLAEGLRSVGGMRGQALAEQELKDIGAKRQTAVTEALRNFNTMAQGTPENVPGDGVGPTMPAQPANMRGAYAALMEAPDQQLRQAGLQGMTQLPEMEARAADRTENREFRKAEADAARTARVQQLELAHEQRMEIMKAQNASRAEMAQAQREFQQQMQNERLQSQREMRSLTGAVASAVGGAKAPAGYRFTPDGNLEAIPGGPAADKGGQKPLTEGQAKGSLYLGQMRSASEELGKLPGVSPVETAAAGSTFTNWATPAKAQQVAQLQNQWAEAYLRAKTGAAATQGEVDLNRRTFFPVVGDSKAVIEQKAKMRSQAERDMAPLAGPGAATAGGVSGSWGAPQAPAMPQGFKVVR